MQKLTYVRAHKGEDSALYVWNGGGGPSRAAQVRAQFEGSFGLRPRIDSASIRRPDAKWARKSLLSCNNLLCPTPVCPLGGGRKVYFRGSMDPDFVFIGEAPGASEEEHGVPFCGPSGRLLDWFINKAHLNHSFALLNTVLCRPPENRDPTREEKACCLPRLLAVLDRLKPKAVVLVGAHAAGLFDPVTLMKGESSLAPNIVRTLEMGAMRFVHVRHPAWLLRRGGVKAKQNAEIVEDTVWTLGHLKEMASSPSRAAKPWSWTSRLPLLLRTEMRRATRLSAATEGGAE